MAAPRLARALKSLTLGVLVALIAGLLAGAAADSWGLPGGEGTARLIQSVGELWLNALKMTIIPLIFGLLVTGIASIADAAATGRLALKALMVFAVLLVGATTYAFLASEGLHAIWPIDPAAGQALIASAPDSATVRDSASGAGLAGFLASLAPSNPVRAAADDAILAVVVFAIAFGFAATRLESRMRAPLVAFFEAVSQTMIVIVHWVLMAAPVGVFALSMGVGLNAGVGALGTLGHYVSMVSLAQIGLILLIYPVVVLWGRIAFSRFAEGIAPAQVVAFSTQSSLASLPAMVEQARRALGVSDAISGLVLPLAVAIFRITSPVANLAVVIYCAHLFGVELGPTAWLAGGLTALAVSVGSVGLPGQVSFFVSVAPICIAMGVPLQILPLLLAVEVIPDIFRTIGNVTADLAAARIVEGRDAVADPEPGAGI